MDTQLFVKGKGPKRRRMQGIINREDFSIKPWGGLWTSTYKPEYGSDWVQWCLGQDFCIPKDNQWKGYLLVPKKYGRILVIDSYRDLHNLMQEYEFSPILKKMKDTGFAIPGLLRGLNYERLAQKYDAIHLTKQGQIATHFSDTYSLYGWDCESTLWLNWCFSEVKYLGKVEYKSQWD